MDTPTGAGRARFLSIIPVGMLVSFAVAVAFYLANPGPGFTQAEEGNAWQTTNQAALAIATRIVAAGDIAHCELTGDDATASLLDDLLATDHGIVAALGDTVYPDGSSDQFRECYEPNWGRHRFRTRPAVGNHEYRTTAATGYFDYFGWRAGEPNQGWYSYTMADWQILVLNSNCDEIGGCAAGSAQEKWLRDELASYDGACTLAYMHHPRFSSGYHGDDDRTTDLWRALEDYGADLILAGHDHNYERLTPLRADGSPAASTGIQSFVVGTGGTSLRPAESPRPSSEKLIDDRHGVLVLDLSSSSYEWQFVDTGGAILDQGVRPCS